jgi:hypothetical protein
MRDCRRGNSDHKKHKEENEDDHGGHESSRLRLTEQAGENGLHKGHNSDRDREPG